MANWYEKLISYFAKMRNTKSKTLGFLLTCHKKPGKCGILRGAKRVGFSLRMGLSMLQTQKRGSQAIIHNSMSWTQSCTCCIATLLTIEYTHPCQSNKHKKMTHSGKCDAKATVVGSHEKKQAQKFNGCDGSIKWYSWAMQSTTLLL